MRTPWPEFIDRLERETYDNDKFVPVQLVDYTDGYDSECAVLFPETVSVVGRPTNHFGGIFCDRESARFRRSLAKGGEILKIDLPPEAEALVASPELALETYILWDLIHDSWHSHGDLPFDPFMIRQRLPYWMYSLEELRVDLSAFVDSGRLAREGFPFARYVQYAMLFDRILRFPITGNRVRNYDGLGGQLLFAYLHKHGVVRWHDNRLLIDWPRVEETVSGAARRGRDHVPRGHRPEQGLVLDLGARPGGALRAAQRQLAVAARDARRLRTRPTRRAWVDRVLNDEFPLSMFYEQFKKKLADDAEAATPATGAAAPATDAAATPAEAAVSATGAGAGAAPAAPATGPGAATSQGGNGGTAGADAHQAGGNGGASAPCARRRKTGRRARDGRGPPHGRVGAWTPDSTSATSSSRATTTPACTPPSSRR